ncbi:MAG TPA: hypothetical protein VMH35_09080 [Streptosporangiaceae bacterium]|nr:hypothetical protein [Streptosporangiaceae bacterium]
MADTQPGAARLALIAQASKRAGLIWITVPGARPRAAWHVWRQPPGQPAAAYVLTGPGEQSVPGLDSAGQVGVDVPSKDTGGHLVSWTARVSRVPAGSAEWAAILGALLAGRLNPARPRGGPAAALAERWAADGAVYRLSPVAGGGAAFDAAPTAQ